MDTIEASGTGAGRSRRRRCTSRGTRGSTAEKAAEAGDAVRAWRERGELPFPDMTPEQKAAIEGTIEYPPGESVLGARSIAPDRAACAMSIWQSTSSRESVYNLARCHAGGAAQAARAAGGRDP